MTDQNGPFAEAMKLVHEGDPMGAERLLLDNLEAMRARHGESSLEYAAALYELGSICMAFREIERAIDLLRRAAEVRVPGYEGTKAQLTYLMNLGEVLVRAGDYEGAESVLRDSLEERLAFYGPTHSGYAYGLEALAETLWLGGEQAEAAQLVSQAVDVFCSEGNPQAASAIALRAYVLKSGNVSENVFADIGGFPQPVAEAIVQASMRRADEVDAQLAVAVLLDLHAWAIPTFGETHWLFVHLLAALGEAARSAGDMATRLEAIESIQEITKRTGDVENATQAGMALGKALSEIDEHERAEQAYRETIEIATSAGAAGCASVALRNYGLFLAELDRREEAKDVLAQAVTRAQEASDPEATGRALIAFGIFLQHDGKLDVAREMLEQGVGILPASHADTLYARCHLDAIDTNGSCGCGDMGNAVASALMDLVAPHVPFGLLENLDVDEDGNVRVALAREPTEDEVEQLNRALEHALRTLQNADGRAGYSGS